MDNENPAILFSSFWDIANTVKHDTVTKTITNVFTTPTLLFTWDELGVTYKAEVLLNWKKPASTTWSMEGASDGTDVVQGEYRGDGFYVGSDGATFSCQLRYTVLDTDIKI